MRCVDAYAFQLWTILPAAMLWRKLLEVLMCGGAEVDLELGGSCRSRMSYRSPQPQTQLSQPRPRFDRLEELLRAEPWESGDDEGEADVATKEAALEVLKVVVAALRDGDTDIAADVSGRVETALVLRRMAKHDAMAREMLEVIPSLVARLDDTRGGESSWPSLCTRF
jgi:hypothetical protein